MSETRVILVSGTMNLNELQAQVALSEDSRRQFKQDMSNANSLAAEMAACVSPTFTVL